MKTIPPQTMGTSAVSTKYSSAGLVQIRQLSGFAAQKAADGKLTALRIQVSKNGVKAPQ